jgi:hypothetical protein
MRGCDEGDVMRRGWDKLIHIHGYIKPTGESKKEEWLQTVKDNNAAVAAKSQSRAEFAQEWTNKELRKLVQFIKTQGSLNVGMMKKSEKVETNRKEKEKCKENCKEAKAKKGQNREKRKKQKAKQVRSKKEQKKSANCKVKRKEKAQEKGERTEEREMKREMK